MPILAEEPLMYPNNLLDGLDGLWDGLDMETERRRWWSLYTKARQEKALGRQLLRYRIPFYLPLVTTRRMYRGRKLVSRCPLFAGYVFVFGTEEERVRCLTTQRVSRILNVVDGQSLACDLKQIQRLIEADAPLTVERRLETGRRVRICSGPFCGLEGTVVSRTGTTRLIVAVNFLQQGVSLEIDNFLIEPL